MENDQAADEMLTRRVGMLILGAVVMLVVVVMAWDPVASRLFPERAARADCEAEVGFTIDGIPDKDDPDYEWFYEDLVAPHIDRCVDERLGR